MPSRTVMLRIMKRVLIGALVGGTILFVWGFVSWVVLHWHKTSGFALPNEPRVVAALEESGVRQGVYWVPGAERRRGATPEERDRALEDWKRRHQEGPRALIVYRPDGSDPENPALYGTGIAIDIVAALLACLMLAAAGLRTYGGRVLFVAGLGAIVACFADASAWNFMYFPPDWSLVMMADRMVGWILAGLAIAAIVRPPRPE